MFTVTCQKNLGSVVNRNDTSSGLVNNRNDTSSGLVNNRNDTSSELSTRMIQAVN